jgi:type II secretory pathway pseudopilin PulG
MSKTYKIQNIICKIKGDHSGITLLELLVSVFIFSITILAATGIFQTVVNSQRSAIASQNLQDNIRYDLEKMGKEVRSAQEDKAHSCIASGNLYNIDGGGGLNFINYHGQCVRYFASSSNQIYVSYPNSPDAVLKKGLPLTTPDIKISNLVFKATDRIGKTQGQVTVKMHLSIAAKAVQIEPMDMETTLSARNYQ